MGQVTQPTLSSTEGQQLVSSPGKGPICTQRLLILGAMYKFSYLFTVLLKLAVCDSFYLLFLRVSAILLTASASCPL